MSRISARLLRPDEVVAAVLAAAVPVEERERVGLGDAYGRVLAEEVRAAFDMPAFDQAAMDGYAVAEDAVGRVPPITLRIDGRSLPGHPVPPAPRLGEAIRIMTGAPVPRGTAAVTHEEACVAADGTVTLLAPVRAGQNIRRRGEDAAVGTAMLRPGTRMGVAALAVAAGAGAEALTVRRRVRVGLLSTGEEVLRGHVPDVNRPMLGALLSATGAAIHDLGVAEDSEAALADRLERARELDLLITSGSAAGSDGDRLGPTILSLGGTVERLRVAQRPGKPLLLGQVGSVLILGLAGNPVAALVGALLFARPLLDRLAGVTAWPMTGWPARLAESRRPVDRTEWLPAELASVSEGHAVLRVPQRFSSAHLAPLSAADGLAELRPGGGEVYFHSFADLVGRA